ncbi:MAG: HAD family hydrolase [Myxococcota bacterium]
MVRIAMWSGPRNVSTALMRSFEARGDCAVVDEPLYAAYLHATGLDHPGRDAILATQPTDPAVVVAGLRAPRHDRPLQFEKHMAHHWPADWPLARLGDVRHAFLVRDPAAMVASYAKVRATPRAEDLGFPQLLRLVEATPRPAVIDGDRLREAPATWLPALCEALGITYTDRMLGWSAGPRETDGVWASHWYARVEASTGFVPPTPPVAVPYRLRPLVDALRPTHEALMRHHVRVLHAGASQNARRA